MDALFAREEGEVECVGLGARGAGGTGERGAQGGGREEGVGGRAGRVGRGRRGGRGGKPGGAAAQEPDRVDALGLGLRVLSLAEERLCRRARDRGEAPQGEVGRGVVREVRRRGGDEVRRGGVGEGAKLRVRALSVLSSELNEERDALRGGVRLARGLRATGVAVEERDGLARSVVRRLCWPCLQSGTGLEAAGTQPREADARGWRACLMRTRGGAARNGGSQPI